MINHFFRLGFSLPNAALRLKSNGGPAKCPVVNKSLPRRVTAGHGPSFDRLIDPFPQSLDIVGGLHWDPQQGQIG